MDKVDRFRRLILEGFEEVPDDTTIVRSVRDVPNLDTQMCNISTWIEQDVFIHPSECQQNVCEGNFLFASAIVTGHVVSVIFPIFFWIRFDTFLPDEGELFLVRWTIHSFFPYELVDGA